jgi:hypothetical protein
MVLLGVFFGTLYWYAYVLHMALPAGEKVRSSGSE